MLTVSFVPMKCKLMLTDVEKLTLATGRIIVIATSARVPPYWC